MAQDQAFAPADDLAELAAARGIAFDASLLPLRRTFESHDGVTLSYLDWRGTGPTVVLLHGGALTAHTFDLVAMALSDRFHCVALDLRGHGDSGWSDDYTMPAHAGDVVALADELGGGPLHVAGMSLGGNAGAHALLSAPDRFTSLAMIDVGPGVIFGATAKLRSFMTQDGPFESVEAMAQAALAQSSNPDAALLRYRYAALLRPCDGGVTWKLDRRRETDFPHILRYIDALWDTAPTIRQPALVVRGGRSPMFPDEAARAFAARFPDGRMVTVPDAGHNVQEDNAPALAAELAAHMTHAEAAC